MEKILVVFVFIIIFILATLSAIGEMQEKSRKMNQVFVNPTKYWEPDYNTIRVSCNNDLLSKQHSKRSTPWPIAMGRPYRTPWELQQEGKV